MNRCMCKVGSIAIRMIAVFTVAVMLLITLVTCSFCLPFIAYITLKNKFKQI